MMICDTAWCLVTFFSCTVLSTTTSIGAMVEAAIIMVDNAHKALEHFHDENGRGSR